MEVLSDQVECKVSAKRMWKGAFEDGHNCMPKASPHSISHVSYDGPVQGCAPGSIRTVHFHASHAEKIAKEKNLKHPVLTMKIKFMEVDNQALKIKAEHFEGGFVGSFVKRAIMTVHIKEGKTPNTCVVHWSSEYEALSEDVKAQIPSVLEGYFSSNIKHMEEYLISHDDYKNE